MSSLTSFISLGIILKSRSTILTIEVIFDYFFSEIGDILPKTDLTSLVLRI